MFFLKGPSAVSGALLLLTTSFCQAQWQGFSIHQVIPGAEVMYNMAVAPANNDQYPDLVLFPRDRFDKMALYRGGANYRFSHYKEFQKHEYYRVLCTGDLDDDGIADLVISGYWMNGFKIFWGNPDGDYTEGEHFGLTGHGKNVEVTDINNDGAADVVALSGGSGQPITLHVFHGNNSRSLSPKGVFSSQLHTDTRITIRDQDGNGLPDVIVASSFPWFVTFYQTADGNFIPRYFPYELELPFTSQYYVDDLDNDGRGDVLAVYAEENNYRVYAGLADTLFSDDYVTHPLALKAYRIVTADVNRDGNIDLIADDQTAEFEFTNTLYYLLGNGDFTFQEPVPIDFSSPIEKFLVADFNNDDYPDIIASCRTTGIVTALNTGSLTGNEEEHAEAGVYPNPFSTSLSIDGVPGHARLSIFNCAGALMADTVVERGTVDTSQWPAGMYVVQVADGRKRFTRKVVKL